MKLLLQPMAAMRYSVTLLAILFSMATVAQDAMNIQLLDKKNHEPIIGAGFKYADQEGISNNSGNITIIPAEGKNIHIHHINYGHIAVSPQNVTDNKLYLAKEDINLQPVAIIGVQHGVENKTDYTLTTADQVNHDSGKVLSSLPEIAGVRKSGGYGFDPVFRGFTGEQLNIVMDGNTKAIAACPNRMDPPTSQVSPNMIDQVEILKGPYSLRYGNSFGGTIQYKSSQLEYVTGGDLTGRLTTDYVENGEATRNEAKLGYAMEKFALNLFGSYGKGNDYTAGDDVSISSEFERGSVGLKTGVKLNNLSEIDFSATRNFARDTDFPALMMDLRSDDTWLFNSEYKWNGREDSKMKQWTTQAYYTNVDHVMDNLGKIMATRKVNAITDAKTETFGIRNEAQFDLASNLLISGLDYNYQTADGVRSRELLMGPMAGRTLYDNAWQGGQIHNVGAFGEYHFAKQTVDYVIAARVDANIADNPDGDDNFGSIYANNTDVTQVNPSISFGAVKHFANHFDGSLWLGRAQRSASLTERYINFFSIGLDPYEMIGNPDLDAEANYQLDANITKHYDIASWEINGFASYMTDYIQGVIRDDLSTRLATSPGVRQYQNIGDAVKYGFEAGASHQITNNITQQLLMAYTWAEDVERDAPLAQIAPFDLRYKLRGRFVENKLKPQIDFRYVGEQNRVSEEYSEVASPSFAVVDLGATYQLHKNVKLAAGVSNLLDEQYYEFLNRSTRMPSGSLYSPGRSFNFSLSADF